MVTVSFIIHNPIEVDVMQAKYKYNYHCQVVRIAFFISCFLFSNAWAQTDLESKYFDSNGVQIHYVEKGDGDPIVLLHGNTQSIDQWLGASVFDELALDYRVIAYDSRGHGKSGKPRGRQDYGDEMGMDIVRLLDHLKIEKAHILGYSMGARVAGGAMPNHQDRFQTVILGGFPPARNWTKEEQERMETRANNIVTNRPQFMLDKGLDFEAMASLVLSFSELAVTDDELAATLTPTLAIVGSEDRNFQRVLDLEGIIPNLEIVVIPDATHSGKTGAFLRPEFAKEVRKFLQQYPIGR